MALHPAHRQGHENKCRLPDLSLSPVPAWSSTLQGCSLLPYKTHHAALQRGCVRGCPSAVSQLSELTNSHHTVSVRGAPRQNQHRSNAWQIASGAGTPPPPPSESTLALPMPMQPRYEDPGAASSTQAHAPAQLSQQQVVFLNAENSNRLEILRFF